VLQYTVITHCNTPATARLQSCSKGVLAQQQNTATHCNTLHHNTAAHCNTLHRTATHRSTLQHTEKYLQIHKISLAASKGVLKRLQPSAGVLLHRNQGPIHIKKKSNHTIDKIKSYK